MEGSISYGILVAKMRMPHLRRLSYTSLWCWLIAMFFGGAYCSAQEKPSLQWQPWPALPDQHGLAGAFAGVHNDRILVAGGANFPEKMPWEGGVKVWHDGVMAWDASRKAWQSAGALPRPLAYGVSISTPEGLICIGGSDATGHYQDVFRLSMAGEQLTSTSLPSLPKPIANTCGALLGNTIYVAGGLESSGATSTLGTFVALDLTNIEQGWHELASWPGPPRMLAMAATLNGEFYLIGGTDLIANADDSPQRRYLNDAYCYRPGSGWRRIADLPHAIVAAPSPAPVLRDQRLLVIGGDYGTHIGFQPPQNHPGFSRDILAYDRVANRWEKIGETPAPRVTAPVVQWQHQWLIVSGEMRPGVRSPEVWSVVDSATVANAEPAWSFTILNWPVVAVAVGGILILLFFVSVACAKWFGNNDSRKRQ